MLKKFFKDLKTAKPKEMALMIAGGVLLVAAIVGVFIPVVPQVPFAVAAAYCFSKGNKRIHDWIRANKHFGRPVRDWEDHGVVRPKLKVISTIGMLAGGAIAYFKLEMPWALIADGAFVAAIVFVLTRPSRAKKGKT